MSDRSCRVHHHWEEVMKPGCRVNSTWPTGWDVVRAAVQDQAQRRCLGPGCGCNLSLRYAKLRHRRHFKLKTAQQAGWQGQMLQQSMLAAQAQWQQQMQLHQMYRGLGQFQQSGNMSGQEADRWHRVNMWVLRDVVLVCSRVAQKLIFNC
jgi:hypothetical protein